MALKSDCPMQENYEIFKDLIQTVGLLYYLNCLFWRYFKKNGHFQSFYPPPPPSPNPKSEKNSP